MAGRSSRLIFGACVIISGVAACGGDVRDEYAAGNGGGECWRRNDCE